MEPVRLRLGELLVDAQIISQEQLDSVLDLQRKDNRRLGTLLVEQGLVNETQLTQILSQQLSVPWVSLFHVDFSKRLLNLIPAEIAHKYSLVPIYVRNVKKQGETLYVAMDDPTNVEALRECSEWSGLPTRAMIASPSDIRAAVKTYYPLDDEVEEDEREPSSTEEQDDGVEQQESTSAPKQEEPAVDSLPETEASDEDEAVSSEQRVPSEQQAEASDSAESSSSQVDTVPLSGQQSDEVSTKPASAESVVSHVSPEISDTEQQSEMEPRDEDIADDGERASTDVGKGVHGSEFPVSSESEIEETHANRESGSEAGESEAEQDTEPNEADGVPFLLSTPTLRPPGGVAPSPDQEDGRQQARPMMDSVPPDEGAHEVELPEDLDVGDVVERTESSTDEPEDGSEEALSEAQSKQALVEGAGDDVVVEIEGEILLDDLIARRKKKAQSKKKGGMTLTLLDGTTIVLPRAGKSKGKVPKTLSRGVTEANEAQIEVDEKDASVGREDGSSVDDGSDVTVQGIITALEAASHGVEPAGVLKNYVKWQAISVALLKLLLKHGVIDEEELLEELKNI